MSSCWDPMYLVYDHVKKYDDASEDAIYQVEELIALVDSSFGITWSLINSLKMFAHKLISCKPCRQTNPFRKCLTIFSVRLPRTVCSFVCDFIALEIMESKLALLQIPCATCIQKWHMRSRHQTVICDWTRKKQRKPKPKTRQYYFAGVYQRSGEGVSVQWVVGLEFVISSC